MINPATEAVAGVISLGTRTDVDRAVTAARHAFESFSQTTREEVFGPVLCILPYDTEEEAIRIANDTPYGLSAYVYGDTHEHASRVGARIRAGMVHINGASLDVCASFGGYKQSGLGREWGAFGFDEFLEVKSVFGAAHA